MTPPITRRTALMGLTALAWSPVAAAAPIPYKLDVRASKVGFTFTLSGVAQTGIMPVRAADIVIDPGNLADSKIDVTLDVAGARTGLIFATQALIGAEVLDARTYPTIHFLSDKVHLAQDGRLSGGARIAGMLTMRGVTRPMTLTAAVYRPPGTAPDDLRELSVRLSGQVSRAAFGASGYADLVADTVGINITAVIRQA